MIDELVVWLRGVLDGEERIARAAASAARFQTWHQGSEAGDDDLVYPAGDLADPRRCSEHPSGQPNMCDDNPVIGVDPDFVPDGAPIAEHIARQDPAATLARVEAHRKMLDLWDEHDEVGEYADQDVARRLLAAAYAHLPGYRAEEWAP